MLHKSQTNADGVMQMVHLENIEIAAGQSHATFSRAQTQTG